MGMIDGIGNKVRSLGRKLTGKNYKVYPQAPQSVKDQISIKARQGLDVMLIPNLRTFDNYARMGKPYVKEVKELAPKGTIERVFAEAALDARGESAKFSCYFVAMQALSAGIYGSPSVALATSGMKALMDSHFKTYEQGADSGKPFLKAIKENTHKDSVNGIVARTALNASGETGQWGAYRAAFNIIQKGLPWTATEALAKTGFEAMNDPSFKVFQHSNNAGKPFLKELKSRGKRGSAEYIFAKAALKAKGEVSQYAAYRSALKHIFLGVGNKNTIPEDLAVAGLEAFNNPGIKTYAAATRAARPFLEAIKSNSPKDSFYYNMASTALKKPADDYSYNLYGQVLRSLQPAPKPTPAPAAPPRPKKPAGPKPLDFLEEKKKELQEGKKDRTDLKIEILKDSVSFGGVKLKKSNG